MKRLLAMALFGLLAGHADAQLISMPSAQKKHKSKSGNEPPPLGPWYNYWPLEAHFQVPAMPEYPFYSAPQTMPIVPPAPYGAAGMNGGAGMQGYPGMMPGANAPGYYPQYGGAGYGGAGYGGNAPANGVIPGQATPPNTNPKTPIPEKPIPNTEQPKPGAWQYPANTGQQLTGYPAQSGYWPYGYGYYPGYGQQMGYPWR